MDKTEQFSVDNSAQETKVPQELIKPENPVEAPESFESIAENKIAEVNRTSEEVIGATEQRLERAKTYYELPPEKTEEILTGGGFKEQLLSIADSIKTLAGSTKEKIMNLIGKKRAAEQITTEEASPETKVEPENKVTAESVPEETNLSEKSELTEKSSTAQESPEIKELKEYLQQEIFSKVGISQEQEQLALSEAPKEKREIIERSFKNMRDSVEAFYELETIDGRYNLVSFHKDKDRRIAETVCPYLENKLKEKGLEDIDLKDLGASLEYTGTLEVRDKLAEILRSKKINLENEVLEKMNASLETDGKYKDLVRVSAEEIQDENIAKEYYEKYDEMQRSEVDEIIVKKGWNAILLPHEIENEITELKRLVAEPSLENCKVFKEREKLLPELQAEIKKVDESAFLSINIEPEKLEKVLESGDFKGLFSLDEKALEEHASELGESVAFYLRQRETTERALGTHSKDKAVVYATLASKNSTDEKVGGAPVYGEIFIKLKPDVKKRTLFTEGDSLTQFGHTSSVIKKLEKKGININNTESFAQTRQVSQENAILAKSLINVERMRDKELKLSSDKELGSTYLEAHVLGGLTVDDFESINIPKEVIDTKLSMYDADRSLLKKLQNDPRWKDKINIVS